MLRESTCIAVFPGSSRLFLLLRGVNPLAIGLWIICRERCTGRRALFLVGFADYAERRVDAEKRGQAFVSKASKEECNRKQELF